MSHDERFWELYKVAFQGLHAQFERPAVLEGSAIFDGGMQELERSKHFARRAWNSAIYACAMFEDDEATIKKFNEVMRKVGKKEEAEEAKYENEEIA